MNFALDRWRIIDNEVGKLLTADFMREVEYQSWIANPVRMKKANGKWHMYIDYIDPNRACLKDSFPLPRINRLIDATLRFELLSFTDAYSGYNQIQMDPTDQEKTAFMTEPGLYCYKVIPFGLKNIGVTYQRLVNKTFAPLIDDKVEVYINDMVLKSKSHETLIANLTYVFYALRKFNLKLNLNKCVFGVTSGKFPGYIVK
ncbi:PREDICTED: uncharacterized protein LOC109114559 [Nelumbo nucifera]|uniref:Uncharacterized protein LOC109114559 n=1 Tax=Nelumbo nucifera TaxID=4432 RepID=A0A1U8Q4K0_NELNU|nr:PREDICTED: uncharacterized protein LOC109114559 [Nelumbo nucifera]